jgi:hypothetical protein
MRIPPKNPSNSLPVSFLTNKKITTEEISKYTQFIIRAISKWGGITKERSGDRIESKKSLF